MSRLNYQRIRLKEDNDLAESLISLDLICADDSSKGSDNCEDKGKDKDKDKVSSNDDIGNGVRIGSIQIANEGILGYTGCAQTPDGSYAAFQIREYQRQLFNRTTLLEDMRKSYLRDVVVLKNLMKVLLIIKLSPPICSCLLRVLSIAYGMTFLALCLFITIFFNIRSF